MRGWDKKAKVRIRRRRLGKKMELEKAEMRRWRG